MRFGSLILLFALLSAPLAAKAGGAEHICSRLDTVSSLTLSATYSVTLPQAQDDVVYDVRATIPDTLSWLIEWSVVTPGGDTIKGWSAQTPDGLYDYSHDRLREHHAGWDNTPKPKVMFSQLLPRSIAGELRQMSANGAYGVEATDRVVTVRRSNHGMTDAEMTWWFDADGLPARFAADYNPGAISSQQVNVSMAHGPYTGESITEQWLAERYPDAFLRCRESNFAVENMRGRKFPAFSLPNAFDEGRFEYAQAEMSHPMVVVIADPNVDLSPRLVAEVRRAISMLPVEATVVWALTGSHYDDNRRLLGELRPGETAVCSATSLAAKCGVSSLPVIVCCNARGTVTNVLIGLNNSTRADVIQSVVNY